MTNSAAHENAFGSATQQATNENTAYATGYSEGFAFGLISDAHGPATLILTSFDHPAYFSGYADGKADGARCRARRRAGPFLAQLQEVSLP
jgi:hypothetical protein